MKININKKKINSITLYLIFLLIIFLIVNNYNSFNYINWIDFIFAITCIHIIITIYMFKKNSISIFSISGIFICLSYIFNISQLLIKFISPKYVYSFDVSSYISLDIYLKSILFALFTISFVVIGIVVINQEKIYEKKISKLNISINKCKMIAFFMLIITLPIEIKSSITKIIISSNNGYLEMLEFNQIGALAQLSRFHIVAVGLLIMCYSREKFKSEIILLIYSIYSIFTMASGGRIYQTISIIILFYIFVISKNVKIKLFAIFKFIIAIFILALILNTIANFRSEELKNLLTLKASLVESLHNNPILEILEEFGATLYTLCLAILKVPTEIPYSNGSQFITGFSTVLPNINGIFTELNKLAGFVEKFNYQSLGGSYIAELYYSFEYLWFLVAIIIGIILEKISFEFEKNIRISNYIKATYYIMPIFAIFIWIRGEYIVLLRNSIWGGIFIFLITKIIEFINITFSKSYDKI